jgi:hypothetical protein
MVRSPYSAILKIFAAVPAARRSPPPQYVILAPDDLMAVDQLVTHGSYNFVVEEPLAHCLISK